MALWIFGDSFSVARSSINKGDIEPWPLWHELLASNLNLDGYRNYSQWGVSNEYILEKFLNHQLSYQDGDYIVVQLTNSSRQWFFKDHSELANFYVNDIDKYLTKEQVAAINMYIQHLQRDELDELRYFMLVNSLQHLTQQLPGCKVLLLPGYHPIQGVINTLMNICAGEFVSNESRARWYHDNIVDARPNHFGEANHRIVADRITEYFQTGKTVNLQDGYHTKFL